MRLVGYCRVSTDNQREEGTIAVQEYALQEFCKANGHELLTIYKDEGVSGDESNRPGLSTLITFLESSLNIADGVLIFKLDRLARDLYLQEHIIRELNKLGFKLFSTKEPDLDSKEPMRVAFRQFSGIVSELEKTMITWRLSGGRLNKARKGGYAGGRVAYGYNVNKAKNELEVNQEQAGVVKKIINMRSRQKLSYHEIARFLNQRGVQSPAGGMWYPGSIKYIVENRLYRGNYEYKGEGAKRPDLVLTGKQQLQIV
jgi:site-specific DNA recombinase